MEEVIRQTILVCLILFGTVGVAKLAYLITIWRFQLQDYRRLLSQVSRDEMYMDMCQEHNRTLPDTLYDVQGRAYHKYNGQFGDVIYYPD